MKDTFILKTKYGSIINRLSDKQAGVLFKMLFNYVENGANAGSTDERVDMAFEFIKMDLDAFSESYQKKVEANKENGKRGGNPNFVKGKSNPYYKEKDNPNITEDNRTLPKITEDNPNDNDNDNDISFLEKKKQKSDAAVSDLVENENSESPIDTLQTPKEQSGGGRKKFTIPTAEEVQAYCNERNNGISGQQFCDFYSSKGWKVGSQPMKDWKAAVRTWEVRRKDQSTPITQSQTQISTPKRIRFDEYGNEVVY
nr:MAG TPA: hypothetical protein [Caudoviricetes sp.]